MARRTSCDLFTELHLFIMLHAPCWTLILVQLCPDDITITIASHITICKTAADDFIMFSFYLKLDGFHVHLRFFIILRVDYFDQWGDLRFRSEVYICTTCLPGSTSPPRYDVGLTCRLWCHPALALGISPIRIKMKKIIRRGCYKNIHSYTLPMWPYMHNILCFWANE